MPPASTARTPARSGCIDRDRDPRRPSPRRLQRFSRADLIFAGAILAAGRSSPAFASDAFLTQRNLVNISRQIVTNGFLSLGMLMVIRTGGIDLVGRLGAGLRRAARDRPAGADALLAGDRRRARDGRRGRLAQRLADRPLQPAAVHRHAGDDGQPARPALRLCRHAALSRRTRCSAPARRRLHRAGAGQLHPLRARRAGGLVLPQPHRLGPRRLRASASTRRRCGSPASTSAGT